MLLTGLQCTGQRPHKASSGPRCQGAEVGSPALPAFMFDGLHPVWDACVTGTPRASHISGIVLNE